MISTLDNLTITISKEKIIMERFEAYERIEAIIECNKLSVNNICDHDCDNCCYCYAQGTNEQYQEVLQIALSQFLIKTNIGTMPIPDYLDIHAKQCGFEDYEDLRAHGLSFDLKTLAAESLTAD